MFARHARIAPAASAAIALVVACSDREPKPPESAAPAAAATAPLPPTSSPPPAPTPPSAAEAFAPSGDEMAELDRTPLGVFEGTLPCADCAGIRTELTLYLQPDTFVLRETYLGRPEGEKTITTEGRWEAALGIEGDPDATVIRLGPDQPDSMRIFREAGSERLELLDRSGRPIESQHANVLVRRADAREGS